MKRRLKIYFIHSNKFDYKNLLYRNVLSSNICLAHELMLPKTKTYEAMYVKDLIGTADLVVALIDQPTFGTKFELKWLLGSGKPAIYISLNNEISKKIKKLVPKIELLSDDKSTIQVIENFISKHARMSLEEQRDKTVILGDL